MGRLSAVVGEVAVRLAEGGMICGISSRNARRPRPSASRMAAGVVLVAFGRMRPDLDADARKEAGRRPARRTVPDITKPPPPMRLTIGAPGR